MAKEKEVSHTEEGLKHFGLKKTTSQMIDEYREAATKKEDGKGDK